MSDRDLEVRVFIESIDRKIGDLQQSYKVLNECHHELELKYTALEAKLSIIAKILMYFISPGMVVLIVSEAIRIKGMIQ